MPAAVDSRPTASLLSCFDLMRSHLNVNNVSVFDEKRSTAEIKKQKAKKVLLQLSPIDLFEVNLVVQSI